jgi:hypothetical protein
MTGYECAPTPRILYGPVDVLRSFNLAASIFYVRTAVIFSGMRH